MGRCSLEDIANNEIQLGRWIFEYSQDDRYEHTTAVDLALALSTIL